jgi:hypothetical protein
MDQVEQRGGCSTIAHFSAISHEVELSGAIVYSLSHLLDDSPTTLPFFAMTSVPGGNIWNARGGLVLSEHGDNAARLAVKLFPRKQRLAADERVDMNRVLIAHYPPYTQAHIEAMLRTVERYRNQCHLSRHKADELKRLISDIYGAAVGEERFDWQIPVVNERLWQNHLFQERPATDLEMVAIDTHAERKFASAYGHHANTWLYQMIFDPEWRAATIAAMNGIPMCWDEQRGSHFFAYVDHRGIEKRLRLDGNALICPEDDGIYIHLEPDDVCEYLTDGTLHFTVFMHMAMLFFYDSLPLGGPMQIEYASQIKQRLIDLVTRFGRTNVAEGLSNIPVETGYISMPGVGLVQREDEIALATATDIAAGGGLRRSQLELMGQTPLWQLHDLSIQAIYAFVFGEPSKQPVPLRLLVKEYGLEELVFHEA